MGPSNEVPEALGEHAKVVGVEVRREGMKLGDMKSFDILPHRPSGVLLAQEMTVFNTVMGAILHVERKFEVTWRWWYRERGSDAFQLIRIGRSGVQQDQP